MPALDSLLIRMRRILRFHWQTEDIRKSMRMKTTRSLIFLVLCVLSLNTGCEATKSESPLKVELTGFWLSKGFYVAVINYSETVEVTGISVTYRDRDGIERHQSVGNLGPRKMFALEPSDVNWTVIENELIIVHAKGYRDGVFDTNILIKEAH